MHFHPSHSLKHQKKIKEAQNTREEKVFKIWNGFAKSLEFKKTDENSFEITFTTQEDDNNSLNSIITLIDKNYKKLMSL